MDTLFFQDGITDFKLGHLTTEKAHPETKNLSDWAKNDLPKALKQWKKVDQDIFPTLHAQMPLLKKMRQDFLATWQAGGRVVLIGCGATGRLSLSLETIARKMRCPYHKQIISLMSGGDLALIHSIESFEDFPDFGKRQLQDIGLSDNDLVVGITEGGETSFVIGGTQYGFEVCQRKPYFLFCNPEESLLGLRRCQLMLGNEAITKISLVTGPQAITGSTRLQASSVLMTAVALALFYEDHQMIPALERLERIFSTWDYQKLAPFIEKESQIYQEQGHIQYRTSHDLAICVLTDTTERSPTFSLPPFENFDDQLQVSSLSYLTIDGMNNAPDAYFQLLERQARTLTWPQYIRLAGRDRLLGFDISEEGFKKRDQKLRLFTFGIHHQNFHFQFSLDGLQESFGHEEISNLFEGHLFLKLLLNTHSTLVMGRMGRIQNNIMTFVRASNKKLENRACRYIQLLLEHQGVSLPLVKIHESLGEAMKNASNKSDIPIVPTVVASILKSQTEKIAT